MSKRFAVTISVEIVADFPDDYTPELVEFFYDGSSHCIGNEFRAIAATIAPNTCDLCHRTSAAKAREVSQQDVDLWPPPPVPKDCA